MMPVIKTEEGFEVGRHKSKALTQGVGIAALLRDRRRKLGMTLQVLAKSSGLSPSFLSQAERGKAIPSIVSLQHLAKALEVDMSYFFEAPKGTQIMRRGDAPEYINVGLPVTYIRLSSGLPDERMDALILVIPPKLVFPRDRREGEALYYVLEGRLHIELGDQPYELGRGDSVHFNTHMPYLMKALGSKPARVLWVGTPPLFDGAHKGKPGRRVTK
jgi:transcriptional regulator with XRE-family HTH domain